MGLQIPAHRLCENQGELRPAVAGVIPSVWPAFAARKELLVNEARIAVPRPSGRPTGARVARVEAEPLSSVASPYVVRCEAANEEPGASR